MNRSLLLAVAIGHAGFAVQAKPTKKGTEPAAFEAPSETYNYMTDEQYEVAYKASKEAAKRKVAKVDNVDENVALSAEFRHLRNLIVGGSSQLPAESQLRLSVQPSTAGIQTADDWAKLIHDLDNDEYYNKRLATSGAISRTSKTLPNDAQFLAALIVGMKPFRGFTVRAKKLISDYKFLHAILVTALRTTSTGINVFSPTPQWKAGFKFVTEPYVGMSADITDDESFRKFLQTEVLPVNIKMTNRLQSLDFSDRPVYFDNKIAYATANFVSDSDRFIVMGEAERRTALGTALLTQSALYSSLSYSWKGLFKTMQDMMTKVYGFEQVFNLNGATAQRRTAVIMENRATLFQKVGNARFGDGSTFMQHAYKALVAGFREMKLSWVQIKKDSSNNQASMNLFDPQAFMPFQRILDTSLSNIESAVKGEPIVSALVQGQVVRFDMKKFFGVDQSEDTSPQSLLAFLPTGFVGQNGGAEACDHFEPNGRGECATALAKATKHEYRNYAKGSPNQWNMSVYQKYFPDMKNDSKEVQNAARVLSQSWGGWIIGLPLAGMVL